MAKKKRSPIIAVIFSILAPGLGQIYNGELNKGIKYYSIVLLISILGSILGLYFYGFIILLIIAISWFIFIIFDSIVTANKVKEIELHNYNKWYIYVIFLLLIHFISLLPKNLLLSFKAYSVASSAMEHTLLIGDYLMVNKSAYWVRNPFSNKVLISIGKPRRGDVAVFIFSLDHSKDYIKRVIGLPGDRVQIVNKKVLINGQPYETSQAHYEDAMIIPPPKSPIASARDNFGPVVVPANSYFVLGDNRDRSYDSRFWGFVPMDNFRGKALYIYFSKDQKESRVRWNRIGLTIN